MLIRLFAIFLFMAAPQSDVFKKDMEPLQSAVDAIVISTGAQVLQKSRAAYLDGYGIVITLEVAFEPPPGIFSTPKKPAEVRVLVAQRRKDMQEKLTAFIKQRVATTDSIGAPDSLAIVLHILNGTPTAVPNLPFQIVMAAKKESPQQVSFKEF